MVDVDAIVGQRIKQRRLELGMTQTELASMIDVRFQQVQKYENGLNRVAASRLWFIAQAMRVPVTYFYEDPILARDSTTAGDLSPRRKRELLDLFTGLSDTHQSAVMSFLRSLTN